MLYFYMGYEIWDLDGKYTRIWDLGGIYVDMGLRKFGNSEFNKVEFGNSEFK